MATCNKCGSAVKFVQRQYKRGMKWCPVNLDGSDHFDLCSTLVWQQKSPEEIAAIMAQPDKRPRRTYPHDRAAFVWIGPEAPWDESLGEFRDFTDQEKVERRVCRPMRRRP
jgi:hypothetical protein